MNTRKLDDYLTGSDEHLIIDNDSNERLFSTEEIISALFKHWGVKYGDGPYTLRDALLILCELDAIPDPDFHNITGIMPKRTPGKWDRYYCHECGYQYDDRGNCVCASNEILAYLMEPPNDN